MNRAVISAAGHHTATASSTPGRTSARPGDQRGRNVFWPERRIVDELLYRLSGAADLPFLADGQDLLTYVPARDMVIVCGLDTLGLEPRDLKKQVTPTETIPRWDDSGGG
ncbi:hypothetical protein AB0M36_25430 [Actinoplanes sp. NPDC051346]|uniref:hypothetical protein n=1 Tax=Actinoplanes sp. NPDC051346 TaxID=3155048 RepID=UPI003437607F